MLLDEINRALGIDKKYLRLLARTASYRYKTYRIRKRSKRGTRKIEHPARELKLIQRWLVENVLSELPIHECVFSYRKRTSIRDLANEVKQGRYLLRLDIKDFFPSIREQHVRKLIRKHFAEDHSREDIQFIGKIVCKDGALTIGAPSSPIISNAILYNLDDSLHKMATGYGVIYARYADDLYFSSKNPNVLGAVEKHAREEIEVKSVLGLKVNRTKTVHSSRKHKRMAVGIVLTPTGGISLGRQRKRELKGLVYKFTQNELNEEQIRSLRGSLSYANSIEPKFITSLRKKYGRKVIGQLFR